MNSIKRMFKRIYRESRLMESLHNSQNRVRKHLEAAKMLAQCSAQALQGGSLLLINTQLRKVRLDQEREFRMQKRILRIWRGVSPWRDQ